MGDWQAIYNLDRPWEAEQKLQAVRAVLGRGAGGDKEAEQLLRGFRIGEERVRKIVLGSPASPTIASTPPAWARCVQAHPQICVGVLGGM